jgi:hypothetical protein
LAERYRLLVTVYSEFQNHSKSAAMIFFDKYRKRSANKFRLKRLVFSYNEQLNRAETACTHGRNFSCLAIGASLDIRSHLSGIGAAAIAELAGRKATIRPLNASEKKQIMRKREWSKDAAMYVLDTTQGEPFARVLARASSNISETRVPSYTDHLAIAASKAIQDEIRGC